MTFNRCRTFSLIAGLHERKLSDLRQKYGSQSEKMIEWVKEKGRTMPWSFWDWLEEAKQRVDAGRSLD